METELELIRALVSEYLVSEVCCLSAYENDELSCLVHAIGSGQSEFNEDLARTYGLTHPPAEQFTVNVG